MKAIGEAQARALASRYLAERYASKGIEIALTSVREIDIGWVVTFQSKTYLDTGDDVHALLGNGPLVIDRAGEIHATGTALPTGEYLDEIRKKLAK